MNSAGLFPTCNRDSFLPPLASYAPTSTVEACGKPLTPNLWRPSGNSDATTNRPRLSRATFLPLRFESLHCNINREEGVDRFAAGRVGDNDREDVAAGSGIGSQRDRERRRLLFPRLAP